MVAERAIIEWNKHAPWKSMTMVEQDLMHCKIINDTFYFEN